MKISVLVVLCSLFFKLKAQDYIDTIPKLIWQQQKFRQALNLINQHLPYANQNIFLLDLYKGICYCGLGQYNDSQIYFEWILRSYRNIDKKIEDYINQSNSKCMQQQFEVITPSTSLLATINVISPPGPAKVTGKELYGSSAENSRTKILREIPDSVYQRRLYQDVNIYSLLAGLEDIGVDKISFYTSNHFVVIIPYEQGLKDDAKEISERLEKALSFYQAFYDVQIPKYKITAYSCTSIPKFLQLAENLHGVELSETLIGYSSQPDLSMVVYNPYSNAATFKHELLHILFNHNVPYLDPWLAEGIPALYEVSRFNGDLLLGTPAWRNEVLRNLGDENLILEHLLSMDWSQFEMWNSPENNSLIRACLARTFVLFLQDTGELQNVYQAYRKQDPLNYNPYLVVPVLRKPMDIIQTEFLDWFYGLH